VQVKHNQSIIIEDFNAFVKPKC